MLNRHRRRAAATRLRRPAPPPKGAWERGVNAFLAEGDKVFDAMLVRWAEAAATIEKAANGDRVSRLSMEMICAWLKRRPDPYCFGCGEPLFGPAAAFVTIFAARDDPRHGLVGPICAGCSNKRSDEVFAACLPSLRVVLPDARLIDRAAIAPTGGRA